MVWLVGDGTSVRKFVSPCWRVQQVLGLLCGSPFCPSASERTLRICGKQFPASSMNDVAVLVAAWFSLHERFIFQSVSQTISRQLEEGLEREVWESLEADNWGLLSSEWEEYCYGTRGTGLVCSQNCYSQAAAHAWVLRYTHGQLFDTHMGFKALHGSTWRSATTILARPL